MAESLKAYSKRIREFDGFVRHPSRLVPFLVHFVDLDGKVPATPKRIRELFEELRVRPPANISDVLRKSTRLFIRGRNGGYVLSHDGRLLVDKGLVQGAREAGVVSGKHPGGITTSVTVEPRPGTDGSNSSRDVLVVYGRNHSLRRDLFSLLRAFGLNPLEFEQLAHLTESSSPFTLEILDAAFKRVQACVVLFSPDEQVELRREFRTADDIDGPEYQPRPNVLIEAGMSLALHPSRTILVRVGRVRSFSDLDGKHYVNLTGSAESRNRLASMLRTAGCAVSNHGDDWLTVGNFKV